MTDIGLPQGLGAVRWNPECGSVEMYSLQVNYPVPDKKTGQAYESRTVESQLECR
ncbi:MAG: hypothetical protein ACLUGJ_09680 [Blautia wexlerae]